MILKNCYYLLRRICLMLLLCQPAALFANEGLHSFTLNGNTDITLDVSGTVPKHLTVPQSVYDTFPDGNVNKLQTVDGVSGNYLMFWGAPNPGTIRTIGNYPIENMTYSPENAVMAGTGLHDSSYDNGGIWLMSVFRLGNGNLLGFFHAEHWWWGGSDWVKPGGSTTPYAYKSIGTAISTDNGVTWGSRTQIITSDEGMPGSPAWSGAGDMCAVRDHINNRWVVFYQEPRGGFADSIHMAVSYDPNAAAGTWYKYNGNFSQMNSGTSPAGLGGEGYPVPVLVNVAGANPQVHWNSYLGQWVMVYHAWSPMKIHMSFSDDLENWSWPEILLHDDAGDVWYPSIIGDESGFVAHEEAELYYSLFSGGNRYFKRRKIYFSDPDRTATPAKVTNVSSSLADGIYTNGTLVNIYIDFNKDVYVSGTPQLTLDLQGGVNAAYVSGQGSSTLLFQYTISGADSSSDLSYISTGALSQGVSILNSDGVASDLSLPIPGFYGSLSYNNSIVVNIWVDPDPVSLVFPANGASYFSNSMMFDWQEVNNTEICAYEVVIDGVNKYTNTGSLDITDGLTGHWKFDHSSGLVALDEVKLNAGQLFNMAGTEWEAGQINGALAFDGIDDEMKVSTDTNFQSQKLTVAFWVKRTGSWSGAAFNFMDTKSTFDGSGWTLFFYDGGDENTSVAMRVDGVNVFGVNSPDETFYPLDTWVHIAVQFDSDSDAYYVYRDGVPQYTFSNGSPDSISPAVPFDFGIRTGATKGAGSFDDLRLYNRILSSNEIAALAAMDSGFTLLTTELEKGLSFGLHTWSVRARSCEGFWGSYSPTWSFDLVQPASQAIISLVSPQDNYELPDNFVTLMWSAENNSCGVSDYEIVLNNSVYFTNSGDLDNRQGLVSHWSFDETGGTVAFDSASSNHGQLSGMPADPWEAGRVSGALGFSALGDYVQLPRTPALQPSNITIAFWVKRKESWSSANFDLVNAKNTWNGPGWQLYTWGGEVIGMRVDGNNTFGVSGDPDVFYPLNTWTHITVTFDSASDTYAVYKDGILQPTFQAGTPDSISYAANSLMRIRNGGTRAFALDDFRIYSRVLSQGEIDDLVAIDSAFKLAANTLTVSNIPPGMHTWKVRGKDCMGSWGSYSTPRNFNYLLSEVITINTPSPDTWINSSSLNISGNVSDTGAELVSVELGINGGPASPVTGLTNWSANLTGLTNGRYVFTIYVSNANGILFTSSQTNRIDTDPPVLTLNSPAGGMVLSNTVLFEGLNYENYSPITGFWYSIDSGPWQSRPIASNYQLSIDSTLYSNGVFDICFYSSNETGLLSSSCQSYYITNNSLAFVELSLPLDASSLNDDFVTLTWSTTNSFCAILEYEIVLDDSVYFTNFGLTATNLLLTNLIPGIHSWKVRGRDCNGSWGKFTPAWSFNMPTPIAVSITNPVPGSTLSIAVSPFLFSGNAQTEYDQVQAVLFSFDGLNFYPATGNTNWVFSMDLNLLSTGEYVFYVAARNGSGRMATNIQTNYVDLTLPDPGGVERLFIRNPFIEEEHGSIMTLYGLPENGSVEIYSLSHDLVHYSYVNGTYDWDLQNQNGYPVASGVYVFKIFDFAADTLTEHNVIIERQK